MKKRLFVLTLIVLLICGCTSRSATEFKKEYEALNGVENANGKKHREISIDKDNPFEKVSAEEVVDKTENKETFYVYFGSTLCPWCRSVIEKSIEVANNKGISKVYYVDIWDNEGNEILIDKYVLREDGTLELTIKGTPEYEELLTYFDNVLSNYNLKDSNGNTISTNEKRIYAPNFIYVENGKAINLVEGVSDKQKDSREELTTEMLQDEEKIFNGFFKNNDSCKVDSKC